MKLYVVPQNTGCYVVPNVTANNKEIMFRPHNTRADFEDFTFVLKPRDPYREEFKSFAGVNHWNPTLTTNILELSKTGHYVFQSVNRKGQTSILVVDEKHVKVIC